MIQRVFTDKILEPIVKPWLSTHNNFVFEKDENSGQKPGQSNIVRKSKVQNSLVSHFNSYNSLSSALIENCSKTIRQTFHKYSYLDDATTKKLTCEG